MKNLALIIGSISLLSTEAAWAAISCTPSPSCSTLGYSNKASDCVGRYIVCPFNTTKVFCMEIKTPTCDPDYTLSTCPSNGKCTSCGGKYKLTSCNTGYEISSSGTSCAEIPCITEAEVQKISVERYVYRTTIDAKPFCDSDSLWEKPLCEDKSTKIFECAKMRSAGIEYDSHGYLTTNGVIGWIQSRYCGAGNKAQCLAKYSSVVLSMTACRNHSGTVNGENYSKYVGSMCSFNKYVCDWCPENL